MQHNSGPHNVSAPLLHVQRPAALNPVRARFADALAVCRDERPNAETATVADLRRHLDRIADVSGVRVMERRALLAKVDRGAETATRIASLWGAIDRAAEMLRTRLGR